MVCRSETATGTNVPVTVSVVHGESYELRPTLIGVEEVLDTVFVFDVDLRVGHNGFILFE